MERKPLRSSSNSVKMNCVRVSKVHSTKLAMPRNNCDMVRKGGQRLGMFHTRLTDHDLDNLHPDLPL